MSTPISSIACFLVAALLGAVGQFLYKTGAAAADGGVLSYLWNWRLLAGVACYIAVMVLFVAGFKQEGASLTVLYPLYASTFIWAALIAYFHDKTPISLANLLGMALLVGGMWLMGVRGDE
jgi:drug/metabolite transporter (DMT)-like permease